MKKRFSTYCAFLAVILFLIVVGSDFIWVKCKASSAEQVVVGYLANALRGAEHAGRFPRSWTEMLKNGDWDPASQMFPVHKFYVFVPQRVAMLHPGEQDVLLIRVSPLKESRDGRFEEGRYIIHSSSSGIRSSWYSEEDVQVIMKKAGITKLPAIEQLTESANGSLQPSLSTSPFEGARASAGPHFPKPVTTASTNDFSTIPSTNRSSTFAVEQDQWHFWSAGVLVILIAGVIFILKRNR